MQHKSKDERDERDACFDDHAHIEEWTVGTLVRTTHVAHIEIEQTVRGIHRSIVHTFKRDILMLEMIAVKHWKGQ